MLSGAATLGLLMAQTRARGPLGQIGQGDDKPSESAEPMTLFLCGDVMTGRGIDQVLPRDQLKAVRCSGLLGGLIREAR